MAPWSGFDRGETGSGATTSQQVLRRVLAEPVDTGWWSEHRDLVLATVGWLFFVVCMVVGGLVLSSLLFGTASTTDPFLDSPSLPTAAIAPGAPGVL